MVTKMMKYLLIVTFISIICFILFSRELYRGTGGDILPRLYYPSSLILSLFIIIIVNKFVVKEEMKEVFKIYLLFIVVFIVGNLVVGYFYKPILKDYYSDSNGYKKSILGFNNYKSQKGNFYSLYKSIKGEIFPVKNISEGKSKEQVLKDDNSFEIVGRKYKDVVSYYITSNEDEYLIFYDWKNDKLAKIYTKEEYIVLAKQDIQKKLGVSKENILLEYGVSPDIRIAFQVEGRGVIAVPYFDGNTMKFEYDGDV